MVVSILLVGGCTSSADDGLTGYVESDMVYLAVPTGGTLGVLEVNRGSRVVLGQLLFELDTENEKLATAESAARLQQTEAQLKNLQSGRREPEINVLQQQIAQANSIQIAAGLKLKRNEDLVVQGFVSPTALDDLKAEYSRATARVRELDAQLSGARLKARPQEIASAEAGTQAAQQVLAQVQWREKQKRHVSPINGIVFDVLYRRGELVPPNTPVLALMPDDSLKVRFYVPQALVSKYTLGSAVSVHCDGCATNFKAVINFVSPTAEYTPPMIYSNENRQKLVFLLEAKPEKNAGKGLNPGLPVSINIVHGGKL